jgi:hypothetical protein
MSVPVRWRKSTYSQPSENCVEVGLAPAQPVGVRDTKDRESGALTVPGESWRALLAAVRD